MLNVIARSKAFLKAIVISVFLLSGSQAFANEKDGDIVLLGWDVTFPFSFGPSKTVKK